MKPSEIYKTGDIIFVSGTSWFSKAIKFITFGKASHVALVCGESIYETDGSWRKSKFSPLDKYDDSKITVFRIKSFDDESAYNLIGICKGRLGTWYSYWDCLVQGVFAAFNPKITEKIAHRSSLSFVTKCDEEVQICHNLARGEKYFKFSGGKNPQVFMEELLKSQDAEIIFEA